VELRQTNYTRVGVVIAICVGVLLFIGWLAGKTGVRGSEPRSIAASVSFDGTDFTIANQESRDWVNVCLELNPGALSSGYTLKVQRIAANSTYRVGAMQFADSSGERFNPFTRKPLSFVIIDYSDPWPDQLHMEGFSSYSWN
jgi:hypothetical protein